MVKAMIVVNPSSGSEEAEKYVDQLKNELENQFDEMTVKVTTKAGDAMQFADEAAAQQYDALFLMGGDGTINEGINGIAKHGYRPCVGVIPLGTVNNFARALEIAMQPEEAIAGMKTAIRRKIDIGKVNETYFVSTVSVGPIPESVQEVDVDSKTKFGPLAYVFQGLKALNDERTTLFELTVDGETWEERFSMVLVALSNSVTGIGTVFSSAEIDDGYLQLLGLRETTAVEKLALIPELFRDSEDYSNKLFLKKFKKATLSTKGTESFVCTVDGDSGPTFPIEVEVFHNYISVFAPHR
ncbi:MAG: diacylglycerol kinase family lipid kinase [Carnobacterium sp.]|uniref:diacylglycerol/lipid kinase family protein n=1 Tax=Carnobacterium sp. TaxID=48221 RepID=UPI002FC6E919